ncbi:2-amino-4-hydroxy-6-hydroxymethyldihydropteridinepyrophosphokinase [Achromobacter deleyi]|uniref:2-amino-4-hydroxy-6-hydroxymethyldihydropteridine pyrophosphokinase n=1 Tax=Achromobacter deleyi TaxID=1353891 RepID=A0A6S7ARN5_9BURK|nr:2-amino-4-hydroxy-6-hydroxymethyldihydropteridine diphosphokinase [Achromobacter deleyi]CAB3741541.1 2-amino-4-hydroxy-6-hydroxymethyldihydropteridinepyrophosphokinase [Achromobacter deleyi]CAB3818171.1 2-amino-4-hydroxy-6-hydroxymethyldihydropteridinepyrophosphokinase [Achromobacter deleyi]CAB3869480.1 2-amino-4-hydroxy-6-hydroxymethyldihydropteridinepyrophosphokinase [Achromobacter deleyi]
MAAPVRAYIGLGANLGDSAATLRTVLAELAGADGIDAVTASPFYRSAPVDATGPDFVNAVAALDTSLAPLALLDLLQALEQRHGRERPYKNAPRTLDLDLLLHGDTTMAHERLVLPHPRMPLRAFVLRPLRDLAPTLTLAGRSLDAWLDEITDQPIERIA